MVMLVVTPTVLENQIWGTNYHLKHWIIVSCTCSFRIVTLHFIQSCPRMSHSSHCPKLWKITLVYLPAQQSFQNLMYCANHDVKQTLSLNAHSLHHLIFSLAVTWTRRKTNLNQIQSIQDGTMLYIDYVTFVERNSGGWVTCTVSIAQCSTFNSGNDLCA